MRARPATGQFRPRRSAVKNGHQNPEKLSQRRQDRQGSEFRLLIFGSLRWNLWFFFAAFAIFARDFLENVSYYAALQSLRASSAITSGNSSGQNSFAPGMRRTPREFGRR